MEQKYSPQRGSALFANLTNAADEALFHQIHRPPIEHPADLLYQELEDVAKLYVEAADSAATSDPDSFESPALAATDLLIRTVNEFYEQLHVIIKCFSAPDENSEKKTLHDFLRSRNPRAHQSFMSSTKAHHEPVRLAANALKHRAARLAPIGLTNHNSVLVAGFYVRTTTGPEDQRGPDPEVHKRYRGTVHTAFSFNHFLLRVAGMIFLCLDRLDQALFNERSTARTPLPPLERVLRRASKIQAEFFPDEYDRPTARISSTETCILVRYPQLPRIRNGEFPDRMARATLQIRSTGRAKASMHSVLPYLQLMHTDKVLEGLLPEPRRRPRP